MNYLFRLTKLIVVVIVLSVITGCAMFAGEKVPETTLVEPAAGNQAKPKLSYQFNAIGGLSGPKDLPDAVEQKIKIELLEELQKSQYFGNITENTSDSDIELNVTLTNTGNPAAIIPALITGFSLYTIPSWATDRFEVKGQAKNKNGLEREYVLNDTTTIVQWLPMLFAFPFNNFSVVKDVRANMYRSVIQQMYEDGFMQETK